MFLLDSAFWFLPKKMTIYNKKFVIRAPHSLIFLFNFNIHVYQAHWLKSVINSAYIMLDKL